ncbi:MAG: T9SS type A sorting domain-containing protein [Saprospiraceae bacterium]
MKKISHFIGSIKNKSLLFYLFFWGAANALTGQVFLNPVANPFSLKVSDMRQTPCFVDLDGDHDVDMFTGSASGIFYYYQNSGTQNIAKFMNPLLNPFSLKTAGAYSRIVFGDLDQDGDFDLLLGSERGDLEYFQNTGTPTAPKFANAVINPFSLNPNRKYMTPILLDLDYDADLDLIAGTETNGIVFQENIGTAKVPKFGDVIFNPFFIESAETDLVPTAADLDNDGDLDLLVANQSPSFEYFENNGTKFMPAFLPPIINPFSIKTNTGDPAPFLVDLDHDGDFDFMTGQTAKFNYYQNTQILIATQSFWNTNALVPFPNPASYQINLSAFDVSNDALLGIYNMNQALVRELKMDQFENIILSELPAGVYYIKLKHYHQVCFIKFIKI